MRVLKLDNVVHSKNELRTHLSLDCFKDFLKEKQTCNLSIYLFNFATQPQGLNSGCLAFVRPPFG